MGRFKYQVAGLLGVERVEGVCSIFRSNFFSVDKWAACFCYKSALQNTDNVLLLNTLPKERLFTHCPRYSVLSANAVSVWVRNFLDIDTAIKKHRGSVKTFWIPKNIDSVHETLARSLRKM